MDRGVEVDHSTIFRWVQTYGAELEKRIQRHLRLSNGSWRVDETYVRVKGRWSYLYRAVDSRGQTIARFEARAMIRKGQIRSTTGNDIRAQADFIAELPDRRLM